MVMLSPNDQMRRYMRPIKIKMHTSRANDAEMK